MGSSIDLNVVGKRLEHQDLHDQRNYIADLLDRRQHTFPGAQPVSFARHHLEELQQHDYYLCEKTDGIRCLMYLNQYIDQDGRPQEAYFLIDRKNDHYFVQGLHIPKPMPNGEGCDVASFHIGTLLDGELVVQTRRDGPNGPPYQRLTYLIFDMLALDSEPILQKSFQSRIGRIDKFVWRPYREFAKRYPDDLRAQPFDIVMKKMEFAYGTMMMFKDRIPTLPHGNDGLIFTLVASEYTPGTDQHILKWKPPHENTIDFRLEIKTFPLISDDDGGEEYEDYDAIPEIELQISHGGKPPEYEYYAMLTLTPTEWEATKRLNQQIDGRIIECYRDPTNGHWRPKTESNGAPRFRDDKTESNHITTVKSVEQSIRDAVSEQDLIAAAGAIRKAWKAREQEQKAANERARAASEKRKREAAEKMKEAPVEKRGMVEEEDDGPRYED